MMIKPLETKSEMLGKAYVHWKSWQEPMLTCYLRNF